MPRTKKRSEAQRAKKRRELMRKGRENVQNSVSATDVINNNQQDGNIVIPADNTDNNEHINTVTTVTYDSQPYSATKVPKGSEAQRAEKRIELKKKGRENIQENVSNADKINNNQTDCNIVPPVNKTNSNKHISTVTDDIQPCSAVVPHPHMFTGVSYTDVLSGELPINVMDLISLRLQDQFNQECGLLMPSYVYAKVCAKEHLNSSEITPEGVKSVQIHYTNGHYLISCQLSEHIYVIDSLKNERRITDLLPQLQIVYQSLMNKTVTESDIRYYVPQSQGISCDCGPFAVANAVSMLNNMEPSSMILHQEHLRSHIFQCLYNRQFTMFPGSMKTDHITESYYCYDGKGNKRLYSDTMKRAERRKMLSEEEKVRIRKSNAQHMAVKRKQQSDEEYIFMNKRNAEQMRKKRLEYSVTEKLKINKQNSKYITEKRKKQGETERLVMNEQNAMQMKEKRKKQSETERLVMNERNAKQMKEKRKKQSETERLVMNEQNAKQMKEKRKKLSETERLVMNEQNAKQMKEKRKKLSENERLVMNEQKAKQMKEKRKKQSETKRLIMNRQNAKQMKEKRKKQSETERLVINEQNAKQMNEKRKKQSETERLITNEQNAKQMKEKRKKQSETERLIMNEQVAKHISDKRKKQSETERLQMNQQNAKQMKEKRRKQCKEERQRNNEINSQRMSKYRQSLSLDQRSVCHMLDAQRKGKEREMLTGLEKDAVKRKQRSRMASFRANSDQLKKFREECLKGPIHVCTSCKRFMFNHMVTRIRGSMFKNTKTELLELCLPERSLDEHVICKTCKGHLDNDKMPPQCHANNLQLDPIPEELESLCELECQVISKRIPFMKIINLPKAAQKGIRGAVVNVPTDLTKICDMLPRNMTNSGIVPLKLKRKLHYSGHVNFQTIRPSSVLRALHYLKDNNESYADVQLDERWESFNQEKHAELWNSLSNTSTENNLSHPADDSSHDEASDSDSDEERDNSNPAVHYDTCLQNADGPGMEYSIAPGEGQRPLSLFRDEKSEVLSFPKEFPTGKFGYNCARVAKLSKKKYFNARLLGNDMRFAKNTSYLFYAQYVTEADQIQQSINIALRKKKPVSLDGRSATARDVLGNDSVNRLIDYDDGYRVLKNIRGSPASWQKMQYDCLAKLRQLGPYTFFMTFSVAEFRWTEIIQVIAQQYGQSFSSEQVNQMDFETKSRWLRSNPVTAVRQIEHMFQKFFHGIVIGPPHPIGQVINYDIKKEFQGRGRVHFHIALHVKDAPKLDKSSDAEIIKFVDKHITCSLPDMNEDEELHGLVSALQNHKHSQTCKKKNTTCRFFFPRPVSPQTLIARPPDTDIDKVKQAYLKAVLQKVYDTLLNWNPAEPLTLESLLEHAEVSVDTYIEALQKSSSRHMIILKREPNEQNVNNYNPLFMRAWQANMDIQFVLDTYACVMYVTSYLCKSERTMSELLQQASKQCKHRDMDIKQKLSVLGNVFLTHREISADEAVYRLLSIPLRESNRKVVFVPTEVPEKRTRLLKCRKELEALPEDSTDIFQIGLLDRYSARPTSLKDMCYADFASQYDTASGTVDDSDDVQQTARKTRTSITLQNNLGKMHHLNTPHFIRFHAVPERKNSEEYHHRLLMLYLPWRNHDVLKSEGSYQNKLSLVLPQIKEKIEEYEGSLNELMDITLTEDDRPQHAWDALAAQTEQEKEDEAVIIPHYDDDDDQLEIPPEFDISGTVRQHESYTVEFSNVYIPSSQYNSMVRTLNEKQRLVHDFVVNWCWNVKMKRDDVKPFHLFLSGGGGVGKSHTLTTVYHGIIHALMEPGQDPTQVCALVTAPTGTAAFNISGITVHSALSLPIKEKRMHSQHSYIPLSNEKKNSLKCRLQHLKVLIIDEISMVGASTLINIHKRLEEIKDQSSESVPFGGVSILAVGDLLQLPPVGDSAVYSCPKDPMHRLTTSLWEKHFEYIELTEVQRQRGDPTFADLLNRVRTGNHTQDDIKALSSCVPEGPLDCLHIYPTNDQVNSFNQQKLQQFSDTCITINAHDEYNMEKPREINLPQNRHLTGGLHSKLCVAVGAHVSVVKNLDISDGLVNGANGVITGLHINRQRPLDGVIMVKFENNQVGKSARKTVPQSLQSTSVPIKATSSRFSIGSQNSLVINRTQYPLTLAWAATIHKVQGQTMDKVLVSFEGAKFTAGQAYVALSRVKTLSGLHIENFDAKKIRVNSTALSEMDRLDKTRRLPWTKQISICRPEDQNNIVAVHLNVCSYNAHKDDLNADMTLQAADIIGLTETYSNSISMNEYEIFSKPTQHGVAVLVKKSHSAFRDVSLEINSTASESIVVHLPKCDVTVIICYIKPGVSLGPLQQVMRMQIELIRTGKVIILGDFNWDLLQKAPVPCLSQQAFRQHISSPTHRDGGLLDHIYTRNLDVVNSGTIYIYYSDHCAVYICVKV